jgi:hypothetical protein
VMKIWITNRMVVFPCYRILWQCWSSIFFQLHILPLGRVGKACKFHCCGCLPSKHLTSNFMETLDFLFRKAWYCQNVSHSIMKGINGCRKTSICRICFVHVFYGIHPKGTT